MLKFNATEQVCSIEGRYMLNDAVTCGGLKLVAFLGLEDCLALLILLHLDA